MDTPLISEQLYGDMFDSLVAHDYETLRARLKIAAVTVKLALRSPDAATPEAMRKIGELEGCLRAFRDIMDYEQAKRSVQELSAGTQYFEAVLSAIGAHDGIQHKQLAQRLDLSPSHLCNIMKKVLPTQTVDCMNKGKYSYYYLTEFGRSYCSQKTDLTAEKALEDKISALLPETFTAKINYANYAKTIQNSDNKDSCIRWAAPKHPAYASKVRNKKTREQKPLKNAI